MNIDFFKDNVKKKQFIYSYAAFLINGMLALSIGLLLPFIIQSLNLSYVFAGLLISAHSVGYLASNLISGILPLYIGRKKSVLVLNLSFMLAFILLAFGENNVAILLAFTLTGIARGATSIFCNKIINSLSPGKAWIINGLHAMFAVGALIFPLLMVVATFQTSDDWIKVVYFMIFMGSISWLFYALMPLEEETMKDKKVKKLNFGFCKKLNFYLVTGTLFFYLCAEQGIIGWLVTYFNNTGLLGNTTAQVMPSLLWLTILIGRLCVVWLSMKIPKGKLLLSMGIGLVFFFIILMTSSTTLWIVIGIIGFGFSMSGVYPTTVSYAGDLIEAYSMTWSFILTIASLGSILMPTVIGRVAEFAGIGAGMRLITYALVIALLFIIALLNYNFKISTDI